METHGTPAIASRWPIQDIAYVAVVGLVMLAALLEWILWLLALLYCLVKVYQKAEGAGRWGIRFLAVLNMVFFIAMRCIFLPVMIVTLPLPAEIVLYIPVELIRVLQWFAFWSFAGLLTIPWLFCVYQLVTHDVGRTRKIKTVLDEYSAPKVVIIMPCYHEEPGILLRTVDSIVTCDYPTSCIHIFLSFDGAQEDELYLNTIEKLGIPLTLDSFPKSIDVVYRSCRITVSRFDHGGKRSCQKKTFRLIDKIYAAYLRRNDNFFLLFIDSDCILDKVCIQNFMYEMELKPGSRRNMLAMTGVITSTTTKNSLITVLQDMEYIHGQLFERSVESGCGAVTCLPGALTILRFSAFRKMAKYYFADKAEQCDDLFDYGKCHLGEDRWLTHLFMIGARERYQIQMNTGAFCKTEAVQTFKALLKQRRRWFLGFITNEACMLTDIRLWKRYPLLVCIRLAQNTIRTTALLFFIMVISILTTEQKITKLPIGFIAVSLGLNWALMIFFGAKLGRYKIMLYPLMFVVNPFFNWLYMVYGIFTAGQRTWGGPRADAGKADEKITPEQAVDVAAAQGDELNVNPETFKSAARHGPQHPTLLLPPGRLEGRFAAANELPGGWYQQTNDSGVLNADMSLKRAENGRTQSRDSSVDSARSRTASLVLPRRVESLVALDETMRRQKAAAEQGPDTSEAIAERGRSRGRQPMPYGARSRDESPDSVQSVASSTSSISLHFGVPMHPPNDIPAASRPQGPSPHRPAPPASRLASYPVTASRPFHQFASSAPSGRSPLARKSFTRLATDEAEVEVAASRRHSVDGSRLECRGRRSISVDRNGRRRLSKQGRGRRAEST